MALRLGLPAKLANTDANDTRYDFNNLVVCNNDGSPRGGVMSPIAPATPIIVGHSVMAVGVAPFQAVAVRDGGVVLLANDGATNVTIATAPVSNSRIDIICARQDDASSTVSAPDSDNTAKLYAVTGTVAASPSPPATPAGSVLLGQITIPAGTTRTDTGTTISQTPTFTAASGGIVPFPSVAWMNTWTNAQPGQFASVYTGASIGLYQWNGTAWIASPAQNDIGLQPVIPASVAGTGVVLNSDGSVTCTASSTISVNGCFTAAYKNYLVVFDKTASSAANGGGVKLRAAGVDDVTANYDEQQWWTTGTTATAQAITGAAQFNAETVAGTEDIAEWKFWSPALARATKLDIVSSVWSSATVAVKAIIAGRHALATGYDGFSFVASTGTITGTFRIYGLA